MGDGVDEGFVLLVAPDLPHEEDGVEDDAGNDEGEDEHAEHEQARPAPADDDPADVERDGAADDEATPRTMKKIDRPAPAARLMRSA